MLAGCRDKWFDKHSVSIDFHQVRFYLGAISFAQETFPNGAEAADSTTSFPSGAIALTTQ